MNNNFSFSRIGALSKLYFVSERKMLLTIGLVALGLVSIFYIIPLLFSLLTIQIPFIDTESSARGSISILSITYVIAVSISMRPYFKRGAATAAIMLPAKNSEKFLTIFFRTLIVNGVALLAISIVVNALFSALMGNGIAWEVWFPDTLKGWAGFALQICFAHALFLFGATLFRRNAFLYTVLCLLGISISIGIITTVGLFAAHPTNMSIELIEPFKIVARWSIVALTLVLWWLSWVRFKNIKIV